MSIFSAGPQAGVSNTGASRHRYRGQHITAHTLGERTGEAGFGPLQHERDRLQQRITEVCAVECPTPPQSAHSFLEQRHYHPRPQAGKPVLWPRSIMASFCRRNPNPLPADVAGESVPAAAEPL